MKRLEIAIVVAAGVTLLAASAFPQGEREAQGQAIVTVLPKSGDGQSPAAPDQLTVKVNGKDAKVTGWQALRGDGSSIELVILIDGAARSSLGRQLDDLTHFVNSLPPNVRVTFGYMGNGSAVLAGPLTSDHAQVLRGLHLPAGSPGSNASPYFCLSDLAKRWPSQDAGARREVLMVTDGVDGYNRRYDPEDPYVEAAVSDSVRAGLVVYSIYWRDQGRADQTQYANDTGQDLMQVVTQATGGKSFWEGNGNPVSFEPYLDELSRRFRNQYELRFAVPLKGKPEVEALKLKFKAPGEEVDVPQQVFVAQPGVAQN